MVYAYSDIFSHKKEGNPTVCDNVESLEGIMLSDTSQRKTNTTTYDVTYVRKLQKLTSLRQCRMVVTRGRGSGNREDVGQRVQICS